MSGKESKDEKVEIKAQEQNKEEIKAPVKEPTKLSKNAIKELLMILGTTIHTKNKKSTYSGKYYKLLSASTYSATIYSWGAISIYV